jgi:hypothetical protein
VELGPAPECEDEDDAGVDLVELQRLADSGDQLAQWALAVAAQNHHRVEDPDSEDGLLEDEQISGDGWTTWRPGSA